MAGATVLAVRPTLCSDASSDFDTTAAVPPQHCEYRVRGVDLGHRLRTTSLDVDSAQVVIRAARRAIWLRVSDIGHDIAPAMRAALGEICDTATLMSSSPKNTAGSWISGDRNESTTLRSISLERQDCICPSVTCTVCELPEASW